LRVSLLIVFAVACSGESGESVTVAVVPEPPGANCPSGGQRLDIEQGNDTVTTYVCNGAEGDAATVTVTNEPEGANCPSGGKAITTTSGGTPVVSYVCNGDDGPAVVITAEPKGSNCSNGGVKLQSGGATQYVCNGNDPLTWTTITANTQAVANHGYIVNVPNAINVTLPASNSLTAGDEIRLVVSALADATLIPASAQFVDYDSAVAAMPFRSAEAGPTWLSIASSADGLKLIAARLSAPLQTSTDGGLTWIPRDTTRSWGYVASSADGMKLLAATTNAQLYTSADGGVTWAPRESVRDWRAVASSADGSRLIAGALNGLLYTSTDSGVTWTPRETAREWSFLASSAEDAIP
jgi:hypothetical protein